MTVYTVTLNGTGENPFERMGLTRNPFSQTGKHENQGLENALASLEAEPIADTAALERRLDALGASDQFKAVCHKHYQPGKRVRFKIDVP